MTKIEEMILNVKNDPGNQYIKIRKWKESNDLQHFEFSFKTSSDHFGGFIVGSKKATELINFLNE